MCDLAYVDMNALPSICQFPLAGHTLGGDKSKHINNCRSLVIQATYKV